MNIRLTLWRVQETQYLNRIVMYVYSKIKYSVYKHVNGSCKNRSNTGINMLKHYDNIIRQ